MAKSSNKFALFSGHLHADRYDSLEQATEAAHTLLRSDPNRYVTVVELHGTFSAAVTVNPVAAEEE